ncbi:MAG TPA: DEAD/DEAH box helicase [Streptosporangiaceae bacterium]|nr:DEAD/DEAH box helicase [Streptosporangiaceae bacterium]
MPAGPVLGDTVLGDTVLATARILREGTRDGCVTHIQRIPGRPGRAARWPDWVPSELRERFGRAGITEPWEHQVAAAEHARAGRNVIVSTPAASGKSLGYLMPALTAVLDGGTVLYLTPTKALAADQLRTIRALRVPGVRAAVLDGDTPSAGRSWARANANYLLTTPDTLHLALLPGHTRWARFLSRLSYVIVDECHGYRGVFGSHVAQVLRRLRRITAYYADGRAAMARSARRGRSRGKGAAHLGARPPRSRPWRAGGGEGTPVFILASATVAGPVRCAALLTGLDAVAVDADADAAPRGPVTFALWEPPLTRLRGENGARLRRPATTEAARLLSDLVTQNLTTVAFVRSRRAAEAVAMTARRTLADAGDAGLAERVAAYRSGYLPEDRRQLEDELRSGRLAGMAATTALELGVNICGLDAVLIAGWPGTRASLWQQAGRAGRTGGDALAVLIARADPLDTYLVHHPEAIFGHPVEATVLDPGNPYVLAPHLCSAAAELPLTAADLALFGPEAAEVAAGLCARGLLRTRGGGWYLSGRGRELTRTGLRGSGRAPVQIVEASTGRLIGTVDEPSAHVLAHTGAVYQHQAQTYLVRRLDLADEAALVDAADPGYATSARELTEIEVTGELSRTAWGEATVHFGDVRVTRQVTSFVKRRLDTGLVIGEEALDLPPRTLPTRAVWWTISPGQRDTLAAAGVDLAGAAHAAEHASIALLPLVASCDRWDIGGVSFELNPSTGRLTVFVYDGHPGGAGFAERGYQAARQWLQATAQAIASCACESGCPACIQSPKCGNGNEPLSKPGALKLLSTLLAE